MALTVTAIKAAKPKAKPYKLADEKGLSLIVSPSGGMLWRWKYRVDGIGADGQPKRIEKMLALGAYPDVGLQAARERRDAARQQLASGIDPAEKKQRDKRAAKIGAANTFHAVATNFIEKCRRDGLAETTLRKRQWTLGLVARAIGSRPIAEIKPIDILDAVRPYLYLSGTPFKALATGEFIEEQIFNWTYTDEQRARAEWDSKNPGTRNPYAALPQMRLLTYQMPDELLAIASGGEFDEFDLNEFFKAKDSGVLAQFEHKDEVQKWLSIIRGSGAAQTIEILKTGTRPPWPYSDVRLLPYLNHAFWFLPNVAACEAMKNLLEEPQNTFWHEYDVIVAAGAGAGIGLDALPPVRKAIGNGEDTKTITLSCGKLTTGVTVKQWASILMLRNLKSPETYFQAAFRVQSPWSISNPEGDDPNAELVKKPICFVFDFAPTRALRQLSEYGIGLSPSEPNPEKAVADLVSFLPVLAYDGANMTQIDAGGVLDIAMAGTSATLLARKWESAMLVNVDNDTLRRVLDNPEALAAVERIEGWRALGDNVIETIINKSEAVKDLKKKAKDGELSKAEKKELTDEEREYKNKRKQIQEKLIKFATRIPAFMYLTDFRENTLVDVITKIEPELFLTVTGLTVEDFNLLVRLRVFNTERMNEAVFAFRRYEDASLRYTGIESHEGLTHIGGYDTVVEVAQP